MDQQTLGMHSGRGRKYEVTSLIPEHSVPGALSVSNEDSEIPRAAVKSFSQTLGSNPRTLLAVVV